MLKKNKVLFFSAGNYIQYPVINHNGKEYEERDRERELDLSIGERASSVVVSEPRGTSGSASPSAKGAKRIEKTLSGIRELAGRRGSQF